MSTAIHWTLLKPVSLKALCGDGNSKIQAIKAAETKKERTSHGLIPSARTQIGSVLDR